MASLWGGSLNLCGLNVGFGAVPRFLGTHFMLLMYCLVHFLPSSTVNSREALWTGSNKESLNSMIQIHLCCGLAFGFHYQSAGLFHIGGGIERALVKLPSASTLQVSACQRVVIVQWSVCKPFSAEPPCVA